MMKFTEQNYPLLKYLKWEKELTLHPEMQRQRKDIVGKKTPTALPFLNFQRSEMLDSFNKQNSSAFEERKKLFDLWPRLQRSFSTNIEIASKNFFLALNRSYDTFLKPELFEDIIGEHKGTLIMPSGDAICYDFEMVQPHWDDEHKLRYGIAGEALRIDSDGNRLVLSVTGDQAYDAINATYIDRTSEYAQGIFDLVLVFKLFKKYAEVEEIDAKSIKQPRSDQPELKTTINGIRFLDASWYTTVIRTEGFGVKGHFRLQPYGPGRTEKRMIYIHEFRKKGYVRRAKLLVESEKNIH